MLPEHCLERGPVDRARVGERGVHLVAERLLEPVRLEVLPSEFPVRLRLLGIGENPEPFVPHEVVVELPQAVLPRREALEGLPGQVVVVRDQDVRMPVTAGRVGVHRDQVVSRVHPLGELHGHVPDPFHVRRGGHIELVGMERQHVALQLDLSPVGSGKDLRALHELRGGRPAVSHGHRERNGAGLAVFDELLAAVRCMAVEDVGDRSRRVLGRPHVDGAHVAVRSPSEDRTSSTALWTSRSNASSTAAPRRSAWFRFTPTRRSCSTAAPIRGSGVAWATCSI